MARHHGDYPQVHEWYCPYCELSFKGKGLQVTHVKEEHGVEL